MKLAIEKRPANGEASYFVFTNGEKKIELETNALKSILLMWVFFATVFLTYVIGQQVMLQTQMMNIYLMKGNLTNEKNEPINCEPVLNQKRMLEWNCTTNLTKG